MKTRCFILASFVLLMLSGCQPEKTTPKEYRAVIEQMHQDMVDKHLNYNLLQLQLQGLPLAKDVRLQTVDMADHSLEKLMGESPILLFRYSEIHCNTCTDLVIEKMNERYEAGFTRMAIIASYDEFRHFTSFVRSNQLKMPIYLLDPAAANNIFDTEIPPYLFVADTSGQIKHPFVPIKEMEEGIDMYLEFVESKLGVTETVMSRAEPNRDSAPTARPDDRR